jgi:hypothetical protein
MESKSITVYVSSASSAIEDELTAFSIFKELKEDGRFTTSTSDAIAKLSQD